MAVKMTPKEMAMTAAKALSDKKGRNIRVLETTELTTLADYFIICTATSNTHVKALTGYVEEALTKAGEPPLHTEGYREGTWVLADYGCVVVHVFTEDAREFYALDHRWSDAVQVDISSLGD
jgi:ribosome-associated protein